MIGLLSVLDLVPAWLPGSAALSLAVLVTVLLLWRELVAIGFWLAVWGILSRGPLSDVVDAADRYAMALLTTF